MDQHEAQQLLRAEHSRVQQLLNETLAAGRDDRLAANAPGDITDPAGPLDSEQVDDALAKSLQERLDAIRRAELRLEAGTFGRSVRSGLVIPDDRLRADPAAELTVEEAQQAP